MRPDASRETQTFSSTETSTASGDLGDAAGERGAGVLDANMTSAPGFANYRGGIFAWPTSTTV